MNLDPTNYTLSIDDRPIKLTPRAFDVLLYLYRRSGNLVTKDELLSEVWPSPYVTDSVLKAAVYEIRQATNDDARVPKYIETVHRRGYRFVGRATATPPRYRNIISEPSYRRERLTRHPGLAGQCSDLVYLLRAANE